MAGSGEMFSMLLKWGFVMFCLGLRDGDLHGLWAS